LIDDVITRLNAEPACEAGWDNVGYGSGGFDGGGSDFTDECGTAFHEKFHIALDSAFVAEAENHEIPCLVDCEHPPCDAGETLLGFLFFGCLLNGSEFGKEIFIILGEFLFFLFELCDGGLVFVRAGWWRWGGSSCCGDLCFELGDFFRFAKDICIGYGEVSFGFGEFGLCFGKLCLLP
jgi:hypothetical protein